MPPWGRPSGGSNERRRRGKERGGQQQQQRRYYDEHGDDPRFVEVEDDTSDEGDRDDYGVEDVVGDRLQFTGYDMGTGISERRNNNAYKEYEQEVYYDRNGQWQEDMMAQEEALLEGALRRIRRARHRGDENINLTREELDALERNQLIPQGRLPPRPPLPHRASSGSERERRNRNAPESTSLRPGDANASRLKTPSPAKPKPKSALPSSERPSPHRRSSPLAQEPLRRASPRSGLRNFTAPAAGFIDTRIYDDATAMGYRARSSTLAAPASQRSLPDDPNWARTSRSRDVSSSSNLEYDHDEYYAETPRRNVSGPAGMSYTANMRRASPLPNSAAVLRVPVGRVRGPVVPGYERQQRQASGLKQEVIEISSDDEEDSEEEEDDGVMVEEPQVRSRFAKVPAPDAVGGRAMRKRW